MTNIALPRSVVTAVTSGGALAAGKHTPVDASSGAITMTLPAATSANAGASLSVDKRDSSTNIVTISGSIRGTTSTVTLVGQYEGIEFVADPTGSWVPTAGHKTKAYFDKFYTRFDASGRVPGYRTRNATLPGQMVQSYGSFAYQKGTATGTFTFRTSHRLAVGARDLQFVFNFGTYVTNSTAAAEVFLNTAVPIKASVELFGIAYPLTFNGQRNPTYAPGGLLISDPIDVDAPAGTVLAVRVFMNLANGNEYPYLLGTHGPNTSLTGDGWTTGSDLSDVTTAVTTSNTATLGAPGAIVGTPTAGPTVVIGGVGDSIMSGFGDSADYGTSYLTRATNATVPLYRYSVGGANILGIRARHTAGMHMFSNCSHVKVFIGTNDIANSRTAAQIIADLTWLYQALVDRGCQVYGATLLPRTTSTDSWATTGNQTAAYTGFAAGGSSVRGLVNAWIRAGGAGLLSGYDELADAVETGRDTGVWAVNGSANYLTADGTHPSPAGSAILAAATAVNYTLPY